MALFGLLSAFYSLGLTEAIAKYTSEFGVKRDDARIKEIVLWSARALYPVAFVIAAVGFFSADWLGVVYFKSDIAPTLVRLFAISLVFVPIDVLILGLLQGRQRLAHHALYTATRSFVLLFATWIFLAVCGDGPKASIPGFGNKYQSVPTGQIVEPGQSVLVEWNGPLHLTPERLLWKEKGAPDTALIPSKTAWPIGDASRKFENIGPNARRTFELYIGLRPGTNAGDFKTVPY